MINDPITMTISQQAHQNGIDPIKIITLQWGVSNEREGEGLSREWQKSRIEISGVAGRKIYLIKIIVP